MPFLTRSVPHAGAARRATQGAEGRDAFGGATREATLATFRFEQQLRVIGRREMIAQPITGVISNVAWQERKKRRYRLFLSQYVEPTTICFSNPEENVHPCKFHLPALLLVSYIQNASLHTVWKNSSCFNTVSSPSLPPSFLPPRVLLCKESSRLLMLPIFLFTGRGEKLSFLPLFVCLFIVFSLELR